MKFNERLLLLRKSNKITQEELGNRLHVTRQTISKWESGDTTPEMEKLIVIADIFNITVDVLIKETNEKEKNKEKNKIEL